jgi:hypothetical protein
MGIDRYIQLYDRVMRTQNIDHLLELRGEADNLVPTSSVQDELLEEILAELEAKLG